jgi:hypothetical protein
MATKKVAAKKAVSKKAVAKKATVATKGVAAPVKQVIAPKRPAPPVKLGPTAGVR